MPVFNYKGLTPAGQSKTGIIDADSAREARIKLRAQNVMVTDITQRAKTVRRDKKKEKVLDFSRSAKGQGEIPMYTRQLATLLKAGIPLAQASTALIEQCQIPDLEACFRDNVKARRLLPDGEYGRIEARGEPYQCQQRLAEEAREAVRLAEQAERSQLSPHTPPDRD